MRGIGLIEEDKGFMSPLMMPITFFLIYAALIFPIALRHGVRKVEAGAMSPTGAWLLAIAVSTLPIWAGALYGAVAALFIRVAVLFTRKDISSDGYVTDAFEHGFGAFTIILVGVYVLIILAVLIGLVIYGMSLF